MPVSLLSNRNEDFYHVFESVEKGSSYNIRIESTWKKDYFDFPSLRDKPDQIYLPKNWGGRKDLLFIFDSKNLKLIYLHLLSRKSTRKYCDNNVFYSFGKR